MLEQMLQDYLLELAYFLVVAVAAVETVSQFQREMEVFLVALAVVVEQLQTAVLLEPAVMEQVDMYWWYAHEIFTNKK
jgi:hypothetical protein